MGVGRSVGWTGNSRCLHATQSFLLRSLRFLLFSLFTANDFMTVSVIIPAYNSAGTIASAVRSALDQTRPADEIVIVDDGSTDNTPDIVRGLGGPIRFYQQENQGAAVARNRAIEECTGELLAFLDADDLWVPEKLEIQVPPFEADPDLIFSFANARNLERKVEQKGAKKTKERRLGKAVENYGGVGVSGCGGSGVLEGTESGPAPGARCLEKATTTKDERLRTKDDGHHLGPPFVDFATSHLRRVKHRRDGDIVTFEENLQPHFLLGCPASTPGVVARKDAVRRVGGFDPALRRGQDLDLWLRLAGAGTCNYIDRVLYHRRLHETNVTHDRLRIDRVQIDILTPWLDRNVPWRPGQKRAFRRRLAELNQSIGWRLSKQGKTPAARKYLARSLGLRPDLRALLLWLRA